jgi:hypothetical protein
MAKKGGGGKGGAKVTVVADKINSPRALARELLGVEKGTMHGRKAEVDKLTAKIIEKNDFVKGQDLFAGDVVIVGKKTTKALGTLQDSKVPNYLFGDKTIQSAPSVPSAPYFPPPQPKPLSETSIKIATPDIVLFDEEGIEIEIMTDLIFEDIGGQEIINISRNDIVNGQPVFYSPIKNLSKINLQFNSKNLLSIENTSDNYFNNFAIELGDKIPVVGTGPNGKSVYIEPATGNLVIELVNIQPGEQVEVEILELGEVLNDTIYGEEL